MYISASLTLLAFSFYCAAAASAQESEAIEPLFLEFSIQEVLTNTSWIPVVEPWASQYVSVVREGRYGDAVWARYHIAGDVRNGIVGGTTNMTVLQSIEEDALGYKISDPEDYAKAEAFYAQTSDHDGHKDIIQTLSHIYIQDIRPQIISPHLNVLDERPGDASFGALIDVVSKVSVLTEVPQLVFVTLPALRNPAFQ
ncbi:Hypothetical protein NCS54_01487500 [Fusarium falciforme]|uniref:Hypothetical protein n=1 Tax=Fusarium falciforme TaxID=195108 RepID=UPI002301EE11|nr:Hypothetical protein NCS54_01487500 [Fusarium falciforme]WAO97161.1 Hypothetical protein NCS54_01487500 [Fusarium falciforme]